MESLQIIGILAGFNKKKEEINYLYIFRTFKKKNLYNTIQYNTIQNNNHALFTCHKANVVSIDNFLRHNVLLCRLFIVHPTVVLYLVFPSVFVEPEPFK